jgi:hypothetical protein
MRESLVDAILGCIVGGAIGDPSGAAFEGTPDGPAPLTLSSADWRIIDDTQLTLATCEALTQHGTPDPATGHHETRAYSGVDSPTGCGNNSHYKVTWSVKQK